MTARRANPTPLGLRRRYIRRQARDLADFDYIDSLPPDALDFLEQFNDEYYHAKFRKNPEEDLHPHRYRRDCYGKNNARWRDIWNQFERLPCDLGALTDEDEED